MKLSEIIDQIKAMDGYKYHRLRATDHKDMVKCYTFWFAKNGEMRDHEVRFLVINEGEAEEIAWVYSTKHVEPAISAFRDAITEKIPLFRGNNPEYEKIIIDSVKEADEVAELTVYKYDATADASEKLKMVVFKKADVLTIRKLI